jgi:hypothetical protein
MKGLANYYKNKIIQIITVIKRVVIIKIVLILEIKLIIKYFYNKKKKKKKKILKIKKNGELTIKKKVGIFKRMENGQ